MRAKITSPFITCWYKRKARCSLWQAIPGENLRDCLPVVAILAHRGASAVTRENTLEAFCEARRLGADGVELDVRRSADGAMVVHHDAGIAGGGSIAGMRVADLPAFVPLLDAAVAACGDLLVDIELKDLPGEPGWDAGYPLAVMVAEFVAERSLMSRVVVSSFELAALDTIRLLEPGIDTGWLTPSRFDQMAALESVASGGHRSLHPHHSAVTPALVDAAHESGVSIVTWTVDTDAEIREMAAAGVDGIITNRPDYARAVLEGSSSRP
jgi:glycerophosphoryl diester phosphodiesterase